MPWPHFVFSIKRDRDWWVLLDHATNCFVSLVTQAELCAAFGLKMRSQQIASALLTAGLDRQDKEWGSFGKIDVDSPLMFDAGDPVLRFGPAL